MKPMRGPESLERITGHRGEIPGGFDLDTIEFLRRRCRARLHLRSRRDRHGDPLDKRKLFGDRHPVVLAAVTVAGS
jgi:hypothetical protein